MAHNMANSSPPARLNDEEHRSRWLGYESSLGRMTNSQLQAHLTEISGQLQTQARLSTSQALEQLRDQMTSDSQAPGPSTAKAPRPDSPRDPARPAPRSQSSPPPSPV